MDAELLIGAMGFDEGYISRVEMEIPTSVKASFLVSFFFGRPRAVVVS